VRIPLGFYVDAALDAPASGILAVILDQVGAAQGAVIPVAEGDRLGVA
jgi:hypothetical protein